MWGGVGGVYAAPQRLQDLGLAATLGTLGICLNVLLGNRGLGGRCCSKNRMPPNYSFCLLTMFSTTRDPF